MEIDRNIEKANKELLSKIAELEGGIKYIEKRIECLKNSQMVGDTFTTQNIFSEMVLEKEQMEKE